MAYLLDPKKITNFNCTKNQLELQILFWICAAGKNGVTAANCLNNLLEHWSFITDHTSPFQIIRYLGYKPHLANKKMIRELKRFGIGNYTVKSQAFSQLAHSGINLRTCTVNDLEAIKGIGPKTARCFLIHTRPDQQFAALDVHILRYMKDLGYKVPASTPSKKRYLEIENQFLEHAALKGIGVAELDLAIWNEYRLKSKRRKKITF